MLKRLGIGLVTVTTAVLWIGCGASILGDDPATGLSVLVTRGPIQPVVMEGQVNDEPVPSATVRVRASSGGGDMQANTSLDGTATLRTVPGRYRVDVTACPGALALPGEITVDVEAGALTPVALSCDTGIR